MKIFNWIIVALWLAFMAYWAIAAIGSAIGESLYWVLPLILFGAYFVYSARREEELMRAQFPDRYPPYMQRTKMLIPFVL
jgi:protein-S-isoprenylcysteine O-methyltransferase Ste14